MRVRMVSHTHNELGLPQDLVLSLSLSPNPCSVYAQVTRRRVALQQMQRLRESPEASATLDGTKVPSQSQHAAWTTSLTVSD